MDRLYRLDFLEAPLMTFVVAAFILAMALNIRGCTRDELYIRAKACAEVKGYLMTSGECVAKPKILIGEQ